MKHHLVPNGIKRPHMTVKKKTTRLRRPGTVIATHKGQKGTWEIYMMKDGTYGNRLVSPNGKIICGNKGFNRRHLAEKNMRAVRSSC